MKRMTNCIARLFIAIAVVLLSGISVFAQSDSAAQTERSGVIEIILFFSLLLMAIVGPAFKKREWPKLRRGYDYLR
jgi:hypothetical protein